jgi:glycerate dehydrogenase
MRKKIVFLDASTLGEVSNLHKISELGELIIYPYTSAQTTVSRVKEANIIITNKVQITKEVIDAAPHLELICVAATGTNNIDLIYAQEKGITVKNAIGYSTHSVAQVTFAMLFALLNKISYYDNYVKSGAYSQSNIFTHLGQPFSEINGKTFGIIGLGNIGKQVAAIATAFGANVIYTSTSGIERREAYPRHTLTDLLAKSDIVSIHAPLNEHTKALINTEKLQQMKPSAVLLNTGRGGIIVEDDLANALEQNIIAGAGIDVFQTEPLPVTNKLLTIKSQHKLILLPHIAWTSQEARFELVEKIVQNIQLFINK